MDRRPARFWVIGLMVLVLGALLTRTLTQMRAPRLDQAVAALAAREYDRAEAQLDALLKRNPGDSEAHMLMAQLAMDRPDPRPDLALEHLRQVSPSDPRRKAHLKMFAGKALFASHQLAHAEEAWTEALRLNPEVPEAGWLLLQQYNLQGRDAEARDLALRLFATEPDPRDRVRLLLELTREDVERLAPAGIIPMMQPAVERDPDDWRSALALGRAQAREGRIDEGLALLRRVQQRRPNDEVCWEALLGGLEDAGDIDALAAEWARVPAALAARPELLRHAGRIALEHQDYPRAITAYEAAARAQPFDPRILHQLGRAHRLAGHKEQADRIEERERSVNSALKDLKEVYKEASPLGGPGDPEATAAFQRLAVLRERLGKNDEALAWHQLILKASPDNAASLAALARLRQAPPG